MPSRSTLPSVPLPRGWTKVVNAAVLHALSFATTALTAAWGRAASSRSSRAKDCAEIDRVRMELSLLEEELAIKDARWARLDPRRRPHYGPIQRMRILKLRAAKGWSVAQRPGTQLALVLRHFEDREHLPVIELRPAA